MGRPISWASLRASATFATRAVAAGNDGAAGGQHSALGLGLVAHLVDDLRRRADPDEAVINADLGEVGVFGQEAVAGMNRVGVGDFGGGDQRLGLQVALGRRRRADADGFVGELDVQRLAVGGGTDGDGFDAEFAAGADDAQRDLAPVGNEDFIKHQAALVSTRNSTCPNSTGWAFSTRISMTRPRISHSSSFISFMASTMQSTLPGSTLSPMRT